MQEKRHDRVVEMRLCFFLGKVGDYNVSFVETRMCRSTVSLKKGDFNTPSVNPFFQKENGGLKYNISKPPFCAARSITTVLLCVSAQMLSKEKSR